MPRLFNFTIRILRKKLSEIVNTNLQLFNFRQNYRMNKIGELKKKIIIEFLLS